MTVTLKPSVDLDEFLAYLNRDDGDRTHLYCCDRDRALCGADLTDGPFIAGDDDRERLCRPCLLLDELSANCGAMLCRLRRKWRKWRAS